MDRLKIGIIFGGKSDGHSRSVESAQEVARNLDRDKYEPFYIGITTNGAWKLCDLPAEGWDHDCRPVALSANTDVPGLLVLGEKRAETIRLDVVFPLLHGSAR